MRRHEFAPIKGKGNGRHRCRRRKAGKTDRGFAHVSESWAGYQSDYHILAAGAFKISNNNLPLGNKRRLPSMSKSLGLCTVTGTNPITKLDWFRLRISSALPSQCPSCNNIGVGKSQGLKKQQGERGKAAWDFQSTSPIPTEIQLGAALTIVLAKRKCSFSGI